MKSIYLGIDNTQPNSIRIVGLSIEEAWSEEFLFSLQYSGGCGGGNRHLLRQLARYAPRAVATTVLEHDPFSVMAGLELPVYRYHQYDLPQLGRTTPEIPPNYLRASKLAIKLAFQLEAFRKLNDFRFDIYYLNGEIDKLHRAFDRLFEMMPGHLL
jgi:hypothetical protein